MSLFEREAKKTYSRTLLWKHCFDSNILDLNVFNESKYFEARVAKLS